MSTTRPKDYEKGRNFFIGLLRVLNKAKIPNIGKMFLSAVSGLGNKLKMIFKKTYVVVILYSTLFT